MANERGEQSYRLPYIDHVSRLDVSFDNASNYGSDLAESSACSRKRQSVSQTGDINSVQNAGVPPISRYRGAAQHTENRSTYRGYFTESIESGVEENTDTQSLPSDYSGRNIQRRNLGFTQMTALMINSVIGSGIFTTPGYVLALTKCKWTAFVLWLVGGVSTGLWYVRL